MRRYRKIVSNASPFFKTLLEGNFKESSENEISLKNVMTYENNFLIVLTYIYGFEINLKELSNLQVCELLNLTEYFDLSSLRTAVKNYLVNLEHCDMTFDSVSTLISLPHLKSDQKFYNTAKTFICANAKDFLVHPSFLELEFDVLRDLLLLDSFYTPEHMILAGVLMWYDAGEQIGSGSGTCQEAAVKAVGSNTSSKSRNRGFGQKTSSSSPDQTSKPDVDLFRELMKLTRNLNASLNVLGDFVKHNEHYIKVFTKYQSKIRDICNDLDQSDEVKKTPRTNSPFVFDFTIEDIDRNVKGSAKSGRYLVKNLNWVLFVKWSMDSTFDVFLRCESPEKNWECNATVDIKLINNNGLYTLNYSRLYASHKFTPIDDEIYKVPLIQPFSRTKLRESGCIHEDGSCKIRVTITA